MGMELDTTAATAIATDIATTTTTALHTIPFMTMTTTDDIAHSASTLSALSLSSSSQKERHNQLQLQQKHHQQPNEPKAAPHQEHYAELKITGPPLYNQANTADFVPTHITTTNTAACSPTSTLDSSSSLHINTSSSATAAAPYRRPPLDASRTALLVVDVQPEYWSACPAVRRDFPDFPEHLSNLVSHCRQQRAKLIWVRADYRYSHSPWLTQFARLHQGRIPPEVYSEHGDASAEWETFAEPQGGEFVIPKTSWSSTSHTALLDLLRESGIDTVLVCGLITSVCVQHSAFGIFEAGFRTILVTDACADRGRARHEAALALYGDYMYELYTTANVQEDLIMAKPVWLRSNPPISTMPFLSSSSNSSTNSSIASNRRHRHHHGHPQQLQPPKHGTATMYMPSSSSSPPRSCSFSHSPPTSQHNLLSVATASSPNTVQHYIVSNLTQDDDDDKLQSLLSANSSQTAPSTSSSFASLRMYHDDDNDDADTLHI